VPSYNLVAEALDHFFQRVLLFNNRESRSEAGRPKQSLMSGSESLQWTKEDPL
jgi:hypothetical protein